MKQLLVLAGCVLLLGLSGCQKAGRAGKGVEVVIEDGGRFPEFLVGRWKANRIAWEFVFEPDGAISSAVVGPGHVEMVPGEPVTFPAKNGGENVYEPGLWTVQYSPVNRELAVEIVMDHIHMEKGPIVIEGKSKDMFVGEVSEDGRTWQTDWFSFPDHTFYTPEPRRITFDPNKSLLGTIIFKKFEEQR